MSSTDRPQAPVPHIAPVYLAELAQAQLAAQVAAQHVEILSLRLAVRYGLPPGATWDAQGAITFPPSPPERGEPIPSSPEPAAPEPPAS